MTTSVLGVYKEDPLVFVWWGTEVECVSALARLERQGSMSPISVTAALQRLRALKSRWQEVQPVEDIKETAKRLLRVHNLRATDSLQLAAAIVVSEHRPSSVDFVCLDERLTVTAQREGFNVVMPGR